MRARRRSTTRLVVVPTALAVSTSLTVVSGWTTPAHAATKEVGTLPELVAAVSTCDDGDQITFTDDVAAPAVGLQVPCHLTIDLGGHEVQLAYLDLEVDDRDLVLTDSSEDDEETQEEEPPGTLTLDASDLPGQAALYNSMNSTTLTGRARLVATGGAGGAGIGGNVGDGSSYLFVHDDAEVRAVGGAGAAGIGGGTGGYVLTDLYTYDRSVVDATGGQYGAGIGGGDGGGGLVLVTSGSSTITATGGSGGAGIGGGRGGSGGCFHSSDASTVVAQGGVHAAGIGGGEGGDFICGAHIGDLSTVTARGGDEAAGVGGGSGGEGGLVNVYAATLEATGGTGAAGIGGGLGGAGGLTQLQDGSRTTATGGYTAIGGGGPGTNPGHLSLGGTLRIPEGDLVVTENDPTWVELFVGEGAVIAGSDTSPPTYGRIVAPPVGAAGQIANEGAITLPTDRVQLSLITDHHYRVTFDTQGGSTVEPVTVFAESFAAGDRQFPADPVRGADVFSGWNTKPDGTGTSVGPTTELPGSSSSGVVRPLTVYATWNLPTASVTGVPVAGRTLTATVSYPPGVEHLAGVRTSYRWRVGGSDVRGRVGARPRLVLRPDMVGQRVSVTATMRGAATSRIRSVSTARITRPGTPYVAFTSTNARPGERVRLVGVAPRSARRYAVISRKAGLARPERSVPTSMRLSESLTVPSRVADQVTVRVVFYDAQHVRVMTRRVILAVVD